ncbi:protein DpdE [Nocardioides pelophilus]|uniref:protein DpdE n=1 Tax=Nocardioides pelophilus TaxID=2172019 RepID=UPI0028A74F75|nr:protein DpdE [Nocardioides pelophilus]
MMPASHFVGRWLRARSRPEFGLGYCKGARDGALVFSYVDVPEVAELERLVSREDVVDKPIPVGTRVWVRGKPYGWHAGVVDAAASAQRYHVSLVGHPQRLLLYQDQFVIRWAQPLDNPAAAIAHGLAETPTYYEARSALLSELVRQRQVARGLSAAISAPINLFQHQVDTAARVLADPVMRYLLADEVGLGKTIEAGIVVRQLLIDDPTARILVLCPDSLRGQWTSELRDRLGLGEALQGPQLTIAPHSSAQALAIRRTDGLRHYNLIVIDEAHNLLDHVGVDTELEREFRRVDGLMALSATPMRGDLETFRRLLALVDPVAFADTTSASFRRRLEERERSAGDVQVLATRRASFRQKLAVLESVVSDFPDDDNVQALAANCRDSGDPHASAWTELADYVREIYRISRRMIRHRRTSELTDSYAVAGRVPTFIEVADPARPVVDEFLEAYRRRLSDSDSDVFARTVLHALAGPMVLREFLKRPVHEDDRVLFEMTIARLEMAGVECRLMIATEVVWQRVRDGRRVIVASSFPAVLDRFDEMVQDGVAEHKVHHHYHSMTPEDRDHAVADFLGECGGAILIADTSMEEGRNLQGAEVLINLDLPLDVNRLDQRIGRLDRYAVRPEPAEVVVFTEPTSDWVSAHIHLLDRGIGVFQSSVSTVQRLLSAVLAAVLENLLNKGVEALQIDVAHQREELEIERDNIDLLEELESVEAATVFGAQAFEDLLQYEAEPDNLRGAVRRLTTGTGSLALRPAESHAGVLRFGSARGVGLAADEAGTLERLLQPKAFHRAVALEHPNVSPFRIGDPLVDWLQHYLVADERGRASAVVRPVPGLGSPSLWLHCEFLVEFDAAQSAVNGGPSRRRLSRRGEAHLQPMRLETWTDAFGAAPSDLVETVLSLPFDPDRDEVLRGKIWEPVLEELPDWSRLCEESANAAWEEVRTSPELESALRSGLETAEQDAVRRLAILEARARRLPSGSERRAAQEELRLERDAAQAIAAGIRNPSMRLVACGACVSWPEEKF